MSYLAFIFQEIEKMATLSLTDVINQGILSL